MERPKRAPGRAGEAAKAGHPARPLSASLPDKIGRIFPNGTGASGAPMASPAFAGLVSDHAMPEPAAMGLRIEPGFLPIGSSASRLFSKLRQLCNLAEQVETPNAM